MYDEAAPVQSGRLPDCDGHSVWWATFGDPSRPPVLLLHGGPGSGTHPNMPRLFDPERWRIVAIDQRGTGRSQPHAGDTMEALQCNTTAHLIADIERLREHLGVERWTLYGTSWGATLAQAYAHAYRGRVSGMILAPVTATSRFEIDFLYGGAGHFLPEAFDAFLAGAPEARLVAAYARRLTRSDAEREAALAWCRWEEAVLQVDPRAKSSARFAEERFRLGFARTLNGLPTTLINSRLDLSAPLSTAWRLHTAISGSELIAIPGSLHGTFHGPLSDAVVDAGDRHADRLG